MKWLARPTLFFVGLGFIAALIWYSRIEIFRLLDSVNWLLLAASILIGVSGNYLYAYIYMLLMRKYGVDVKYSLICRMHFYSQIVKYVPGKIWSLMYQKTHLPETHALGAIFLSSIDMMLISIIVVSSLSVGILLFNLSTWLPLLVAVLSFLLFVVVVRTFFFEKLLNPLLKRFVSKYALLTSIDMKFPFHYAFATFMLLVVVHITSYALMLGSAFSLECSVIPPYIAYLGLAWVAGVLVLIAPGGMGVRELIFIFIAQISGIDIPLEEAAAIAVIVRIWLVLQEFLGIAIYHVLVFSIRKSISA